MKTILQETKAILTW